jgi:hypothetical protein
MPHNDIIEYRVSEDLAASIFTLKTKVKVKAATSMETLVCYHSHYMVSHPRRLWPDSSLL